MPTTTRIISSDLNLDFDFYRGAGGAKDFKSVGFVIEVFLLMIWMSPLYEKYQILY